MSVPPAPASPTRSRVVEIARIVVVVVAVLWLVELLDVLVFDDSLERQGIQPRELDGLDGVLWAPFLHDDFAHLAANTLPLMVLAALVMARSVPRWFRVSLVVVLVGGFATWLMARSGNHVGASGVVFGYLGYLLAAGFFERSLRSVALGVLVAVMYGGLLWGVLPTTPGVSFEGHLFGLLAGVAAAPMVGGRPAAG